MIWRAEASILRWTSQNFETLSKSIHRGPKDAGGFGWKLSFHKFWTYSKYFNGSPLEANCIPWKSSGEFVQLTQKLEKRFYESGKSGWKRLMIFAPKSDPSAMKRKTRFIFIAVRSIVFQNSQGESSVYRSVKRKVREMIHEGDLWAKASEEIFHNWARTDQKEVDIFEADFLARLMKIKLPHTKVKLLQSFLAKGYRWVKQIK